MNFADYQQEMVQQIYHLLIDNDNNKGISLHGDTGCGKTTIALGVTELLQEGWTVFFIEGIDSNLAPYLTWHIGTKMYSKRKMDLCGEISFGINFLPMPISLEFSSSVQNNKQNFVLTSTEESLIDGIRKQSAGRPNILFVADNYEFWDIPSKQFLQKIMHSQLNLLDEFYIATLFVSHDRVTIDSNIPCFDIPIEEITNDSIIYILRQKGYSGRINIKDIRACAGNNLILAIMAADYYEKSDSRILNFSDIMEKRCKDLSPQNQKACKILEPLSIIDSCFTKDEAAYFIDTSLSATVETEYLAEEYLTLAEEQMFIVGEESYHFVNEQIKAYFKKQLSKKEEYHHRKFSDYLQKQHPEDYFNRGKHLKLSMRTNDPQIIFEAWQLLFLAYLRRSSELGKMDDIYNILANIDSLLNCLNHQSKIVQLHTLNEFLVGYQEFSKYNYKKAIIHLQSITPSRLIPASLVECQRLILLCHIQLAENPIAINQLAEELFETINTSDFYEAEQYCRTALVLLDVYSNRINDGQKVKIIKKKFNQIIQQHMGNVIFEEFEACYNRKASLYYSAIVASRQTNESINFYHNHFNRNGLYMALCNHLGNTIVAGDYITARHTLDKCDEMLKKNDGWYYPSRYKVENNRILLEFLLNEKECIGNPNHYLAMVKKTALAFSEIILRQENEISHVILFNYLGLSFLCGAKSVEKELKEVTRELQDIDEYYQYYLHDLLFAQALLHNNVSVAQKELCLLMALDIPLLREYKQIFRKRQIEQEHLLDAPQKLNGNPMKYHATISAACAHIQDSSCQFFGRGFLLSDLQFLSL